jgi:hypothetical protein
LLRHPAAAKSSEKAARQADFPPRRQRVRQMVQVGNIYMYTNPGAMAGKSLLRRNKTVLLHCGRARQTKNSINSIRFI